jgi:Tol biopolymer transport system component
MRKLIVLSLLAGLALAALFALPAAARAPGVNGQIAFARLIPTGGANVFTANPDGTNAQQVPLVYPAEDFGVPVWSPDGSELLISQVFRFDSGGECCLPFRPAIVNPDGSDFTLLTIPNGQFDMGCDTWNGDGTRLLCNVDFENFGGEAPGGFSVRASDGGDLVRLTTNSFGAEDRPTDISPDGTRFVFKRFRPGPSGAHFRANQVGLFVENIDGTGLRQITPYGLALAHEFASAQWSPDGKEIISATTQGDLFTVHPDGNGLNLIHLQSKGFAFEPDWSPDGTQIVFCMGINGQEDIYTANADGSNVKQVTDTPDFENGPDWGTHPLAG